MLSWAVKNISKRIIKIRLRHLPMFRKTSLTYKYSSLNSFRAILVCVLNSKTSPLRVIRTSVAAITKEYITNKGTWFVKLSGIEIRNTKVEIGSAYFKKFFLLTLFYYKEQSKS